MSRIGKSPHPRAQRRRRHHRRPPRHREGPEGHPRARHPRRHHRPPGRRRARSSSAPTTSARTGPCTASSARSSTTWSSASPRVHARSSRSSASATAPPPRAPSKLELALGFSHPVQVEAPDGITFEVPSPDPHRRAGHRQGAGRPGGRQHPHDPQARALQGQGRPVPRRARRPQGRQDGQVRTAMTVSAKHKREARIRRHRRVRKKVRGHGRASAPRRVPLEQAHRRPGDRRPRRPHPGRRLHHRGRPARRRHGQQGRRHQGRPARRRAGQGRRRRPRSSSTAAASSTTAASRRSPTPPAKPDWSSDGTPTATTTPQLARLRGSSTSTASPRS